MSDPDSPPASLGRILALARPQLPLLTVATLALVISGGLTLVYPQAVRWMVDAVAEEGDLSALNQAAVVLVVLFAVQAVFSMLRAWLFTVAGERVVARLRQDLYGAILGQDIGFFDQARTGELTNRLASDTTVLQNTVTVNVSMALRYGMGAVGGVALLVWMSPRLALVALAVVPVVAIAASLYGRVIRRLSREVQDALAASTEVAEETFAGVRTVRAFAREPQEEARYGAAVDRSYRLAARRALAYGSFQGLAGFAGYGAIALVVWYGGCMVLGGTMTMGELTAFLDRDRIRRYLGLARLREIPGSGGVFRLAVNGEEAFVPPGLLFGLHYAWYLNNAFGCGIDHDASMLKLERRDLIPWFLMERDRRRRLIDFFRREVFGH